MRVLAVAQVLQLDQVAVGLGREGQAHRRTGLGARLEVDGGQVVADGGVVVGNAVERRHRQRKAQLVRQLASGFQFGQHGGVLRGVGQHADVLPVLGGAAHHGRTTDVDVLDCVFQRTAGLGHGRLEGIEVDHQQVDGVDAVRLQGRHVLGHIATRQQAAVHLGVQGLDAAVQHFGKGGDFGHLGHRQALFGQQLGGAAGGDELDAQRVQGLGKVDDAGLVGNGNECVHGWGLLD